MKKFLVRLLKGIAAMGLGGLIATQTLQHQGVDPVTAQAIGGAVEQRIDDAAAKLGEE